MIDTNSIENFLRWSEILKDGFAELHALERVDSHFKKKYHEWSLVESEVISFAQKNQDRLVVIGMNPRPRHYHTSTNDAGIEIYKNFYVDIEPIHPTDKPASSEELKKCEEFLYELSKQYPWISREGVKAFSGNGYHYCLAIHLHSGISPATFYAYCKSFYRNLINSTKEIRTKLNCRIDNTFSPSRQVKLYGTAKPIEGSRISSFPDAPRKESKEVLEAILEYPMVESVKEQVIINLKDKTDLDTILKKYNLTLEYLYTYVSGCTLDDNSRSGKDYVLIYKLVKYDHMTDSEIYTIVDNIPWNHDKEITEQYVAHTIRKIRENIMEDAKISIDMQSVSKPLQKFIRYADLREKEYVPPVVFKTGLGCLDTYLDGGLALGELSMLLAPQETGKSNLACFIGAKCKKQNYNVLHVYFNEDDDGAIKKRYDSVLAIDHSDSEVFFSNTSMKIDIPDIEAGIKECKPGLVIIDYLNRLPSIGEGDRFRIKTVLEKFGDLAKENNCHIMICDHVTVTDPWIDYQKWDERRIQEAKYKMRHTRVAESKMYKLALVSVMIGMIRDEEADNVVWFTGMKMKRKNNKFFQPISVDYDKCNYKEL